jgi:bud site selection protein 20
MVRVKNKNTSRKKVLKYKKGRSTSRRKTDLDQIQDEFKDPKSYEDRPIDITLPGLGQFYCMICARHFNTQNTHDEHTRTKQHKRRIKVLREEKQYTQREAEWASGMGKPDNGVVTRDKMDQAPVLANISTSSSSSMDTDRSSSSSSGLSASNSLCASIVEGMKSKYANPMRTSVTTKKNMNKF